MAESVVYKQRNRRDRRAVLESDFSKGMMSTEGVIDEGYVKSLVNFTFEKETHSLVPRPGIGMSHVIFPDVGFTYTEEMLSDRVGVKASRECLENGVIYNQIILGRLNDNSDRLGKIWVDTSRKAESPMTVHMSDDFDDTVSFSKSDIYSQAHKCYFYTAGDTSVHKTPLVEDSMRRIEFPVGCFAFGNSYYFFGEDGSSNKGLFRTFFDSAVNNQYVFETVIPKVPTVSEAVTYGYNMLLGNSAYTFGNRYTASKMQFDGILPYAVDASHSHTKLIMSPKRNQPLDLVCYYNAPSTASYKIVWEWREVTASDWTVLQIDDHVDMSGSPELYVNNFIPPATDIMIRISAYPYDNGTLSDIVDQAMVVGLNFSMEDYGTPKTADQKTYDLTSAAGITSWNGRLVVWGLPEDPTILFISDYNEPSYFPYPNNITVFDSPIIHVEEFMDGLVVFTTDKLYQVTLADDGSAWNTTLLQSHLYLSSWDRHLVQTVRNMLYFKSGNYYYMMVPKAQSTTGELTIAPITTPITSFFDHFDVNVQQLLKDTYGYTDEYHLLTYYNFLDYDDVHNLYVYSFDESAEVLNLDIIYNTSDRTWKVWLYQTTNILYPYKQDATQSGLLATTSLIRAVDATGSAEADYMRIIQIYEWDKLSVLEFFVPSSLALHYYASTVFPYVNEGVLHINEHCGTVANGVWTINRAFAYVEEPILYLTSQDDYYAGFSKFDIRWALIDIFRNPEDYFTFLNYQFIDTGYRNDELYSKKRYREIQLQLNNLDKWNLDFGMEYILDGAPREVFYKYDVAQTIDELNPNYGVVYVDSTPYLETELEGIDLMNQWTLEQDIEPEISLWKVRIAVSGKGSAPRLKLHSKNAKRFELLGINWISRLMHMR